MVSRDKKRKRLMHVAELAGVSLSTVDRVLNERGSVSDTKRRKVLMAAKSLGINRTLPSPIHGLLRIDLIIVDSPSDHFRRLNAAFSRQADMLKSRLVLQRYIWNERSPEELLHYITAPRTGRQGLIVVAHDTPDIRRALEAQIDAGIPVILLTSSLSGLTGATYIGVDNYTAGRSAGSLLTKWLPAKQAKVLLITNSLLYEAHRQRVQGFLDVMRARAPELKVSQALECHDDDALNGLAVRKALQKDPELAAIYTTGSGSAGIHRVLCETGARPVWIGHEASQQHSDMLKEGVLSLVLDQDPEGQAEAAIQHLLYANGDLDVPPKTSPQLRIVIDENPIS